MIVPIAVDMCSLGREPEGEEEMIIGLEFLNSINENIIVIADGQKREFCSGREAKDYYIQAPGKYSVKRIQIEDGIITIYIGDNNNTIEVNTDNQALA